MQTPLNAEQARPRLQPLPGCVAAIFALAAPTALSNTVTVFTCAESGDGSLRGAIANAGNGDTVDMTGLVCGTISLTTGAITILQDTLTLLGPGMDNLLVHQANDVGTVNDRIFYHHAYGLLSIHGLSVADGYFAPNTASAAGGCIRSKGSVALYDVRVHSCTASAQPGYFAIGGGVNASQGLHLVHSTIDSNQANGESFAFGGGVFVTGDFVAEYSTIANNAAHGSQSYGGGLSLRTNVTITNSTISGNSAGFNSGGIEISTFGATGFSAAITNSTISGNSAFVTGGMTSTIATALRSTTIAFNYGAVDLPGSAAGVTFDARFSEPITVDLQSTLISNNTHGSSHLEHDFSNSTETNTVTVSGADNLIRLSFNPVPADTIILACPRLGPLRDNGGATQTHALLSGSPGIDVGNNAAAQAYDQRGTPYVRPVDGADIGAYEVQQADIVFNAGFDGCPDLPF